MRYLGGNKLIYNIKNARLWSTIAATGFILSSCGGDDQASSAPILAAPALSLPPLPLPPPPPPPPVVGVTQTLIVTLKSPWAMTFMPDGRLLVTDNQTKDLYVITQAGAMTTVSGLPDRLGIYDVALSNTFASDHMIYLTYPEPSLPDAPRNGPYIDDPTRPNALLALATARIDESGGKIALANFKVIWRQSPNVVASGEFGGRIVMAPDKLHLFLTAGDRSAYYPAKALDNTLGKIVRLNLDGSVPSDNPFVATPGAMPEIWTLGHRNHYGLAFAPDGRLWETEHGPKGGDEFNLITPGNNYGWPTISSGDGYDGTPIPKPAAGDGFATSAYIWTPSIAPAGMMFYSGAVFGDWKGDALLTGLVSKALIRVRIEGDTAKEVQRIDLGARAREIEQGPDGSLWVLLDSPDGKLVKLSPVF